jgi:type VI secretion system protein ImpB
MDGKASPAPERLNIVLKSQEGGGAPTELPLKLLFVGDYMGKDDRPIEERVPVRVDRDTFARVLAAHAPRLDLVAANARVDDAPGIRVSLRFQEMSDFGPDSVARQIPEVARLLAARDLLAELKATGDVATFREKLGVRVDSPELRARVLASLGMEDA